MGRMTIYYLLLLVYLYMHERSKVVPVRKRYQPKNYECCGDLSAVVKGLREQCLPCNLIIKKEIIRIEYELAAVLLNYYSCVGWRRRLFGACSSSRPYDVGRSELLLSLGRGWVQTTVLGKCRAQTRDPKRRRYPVQLHYVCLLLAVVAWLGSYELVLDPR